MLAADKNFKLILQTNKNFQTLSIYNKEPNILKKVK